MIALRRPGGGRRSRPRRRLLDRVTPVRLRVWYGPAGMETERYGWGCHRCARRDDGPLENYSGWTRSLAGARAKAKEHARTHVGMRAVYTGS